ncbi:hypothetical protein [Nostoc sp. CCY 9925]|uniref:hypothetical protein n=1 Tax=Nostoc sp. CCY 9925 TaxID=3103865 RepID=UPI0039C6ACE1
MDATHGIDTAMLIGINLTLKRRLETARQSPLLSETLREQVDPAACGGSPCCADWRGKPGSSTQTKVTDPGFQTRD